MSTELVHVATADEIATLPQADRAVMVTQALVESKQWLAVATQGTDPTPIADFKAWAATVAEMTRQKGLASEIQADALEMVRRAERGIGVAIRNGQDAGEIRRNGERGPLQTAYERVRNGRNEHVQAPSGEPTTSSKPSPSDFASHEELTAGAYPFAEATDEEFEEVLTEAREEGNLSRANVVRKVRRQGGPQTRDQRADLVRKWAEQGHTRAQVADRLGYGREAVNNIASDYSIHFPADVTAKTRRLDSVRVTRETVQSLEGLVIALPMVDVDQLDPREAQHWTASLDQSIRALNRFNKKIKEAVL